MLIDELIRINRCGDCKQSDPAEERFYVECKCPVPTWVGPAVDGRVMSEVRPADGCLFFKRKPTPKPPTRLDTAARIAAFMAELAATPLVVAAVTVSHLAFLYQELVAWRRPKGKGK